MANDRRTYKTIPLRNPTGPMPSIVAFPLFRGNSFIMLQHHFLGDVNIVAAAPDDAWRNDADRVGLELYVVTHALPCSGGNNNRCARGLPSHPAKQPPTSGSDSTLSADPAPNQQSTSRSTAKS